MGIGIAKRTFWAGLATWGLILGSPPAGAAVVSGVFSGTITYSNNAEGLFGATASLIGQPISGTFSYDTAQLPTRDPSSTATRSAWVEASPVAPTMTMSQTVNGVTVGYGGGYYQNLTINHGNPPLISNVPGYQLWNLISDDIGPADVWEHFSSIEIGSSDDSTIFIGDPSDPAVSFSLSPPAGFGKGTWSDTADCPSGPACRAWEFTITQISASVPEPSGLGLMAVGLAAWVGRRRRR